MLSTISTTHIILREVSRIAMAAGFLAFWIWPVYTRQCRIVENRDHQAGIQTLFSGRK